MTFPPKEKPKNEKVLQIAYLLCIFIDFAFSLKKMLRNSKNCFYSKLNRYPNFQSASAMGEPKINVEEESKRARGL